MVALNQPGRLKRAAPGPEWTVPQHFSPNRQYRCTTLKNSSRVLVIKQARASGELRRVDVGRPCDIQGWSRDNRKVLFVKSGSYSGYSHQNDQLCALDVKTGRVQLIVSSFTSVREAQYSPNGQWIAFTAGLGDYQKPGYKGGIFICLADGSLMTQVTKNVAFSQSEADDREVIWLPDGKSLVFRRTFYEDEGI
jgi:Tol biopolymer transport system component